MIKINLLDYRKIKRKEGIQKGILFSLLLLVLSLGGIGVLSYQQRSEIVRINGEIKKVEDKLNDIKKVVDTVKEFEEKKKRLEHIINVISGLRANQTNPASIMDDINMSLPNEIWLTSFSEDALMIKLQGFSFSDPGIAVFMKNLERLRYLSNIELQESKQASIQGEKVRNFVINCGRKGKEIK
jgi:type IV pilus assembly protein PilN